MFYWVIIAFIVIITGLNVLYKQTNHYKDYLSDINKFKKPILENTRIAVIGSNQPKYAFDFQEANINGVNWAVGPEAFEYDYIILKKFASHLAPGTVVVIPVCLFSFFLYRFDNLKTYLKYYNLLSKDEFPQYTFTGKAESFFPILFNPKLVRYIFIDIKQPDSLCIDCNPMGTNDELNKDANNWIHGWEKQFNISLSNMVLSSKNKNDISQNVSLLASIVDYCKNANLRPVITILPVTDYLLSKLDESFIYNYLLSLIQKANNNAPILNYLQDERYKSPSLFFNSFFLNKKGRRLFTKGFIEDLKKLGLYD